MIRLFWFLVRGTWHLHTWKIIEKIDLGNGRGGTVGQANVLQCTSCGDVKAKRWYNETGW